MGDGPSVPVPLAITDPTETGVRTPLSTTPGGGQRLESWDQTTTESDSYSGGRRSVGRTGVNGVKRILRVMCISFVTRQFPHVNKRRNKEHTIRKRLPTEIENKGKKGGVSWTGTTRVSTGSDLRITTNYRGATKCPLSPTHSVTQPKDTRGHMSYTTVLPLPPVLSSATGFGPDPRTHLKSIGLKVKL